MKEGLIERCQVLWRSKLDKKCLLDLVMAFECFSAGAGLIQLGKKDMKERET